jgi:hypothetical protein
MEKIRISVKGTKCQAGEALAARGLQAQHVDQSSDGQSSFWDVPEGPHARQSLVAWFCEPIRCYPGQGFPVGSLLHHG